MAQKDYDPGRSSIAVGQEKKRGLLPLLLGLLALLIIAAIIIGLVSCGSDDDKTTSVAAPVASTPAAPATPATPAPAAGAGTLVAGSASLLGSDAAGISDHGGEGATGTGVKVLSVAESGSGFFVGTDDSDRQYVEFGGKVGGDETSSKLPKVGDTVDLTGPIKAAPKSAGTTLKLNAADAATVSMRGFYINADSVKQSAGG